MARLRTKNKLNVDIPIVAMADVCFFLIIFFVAMSSFSVGSRLRQELPGDKSAQAANQPSPPVVQVTADTLLLDQRKVEFWQLTEDLETLLHDRPKSEDRVVILSADGAVPMQRVVDAMDAIRQANAAVGNLDLKQ